jgi:hypothetical protein
MVHKIINILENILLSIAVIGIVVFMASPFIPHFSVYHGWTAMNWYNCSGWIICLILFGIMFNQQTKLSTPPTDDGPGMIIGPLLLAGGTTFFLNCGLKFLDFLI